VAALDATTAASPLARVVEGLVLASAPAATPEQMANSIAMLQLDVAEPDFRAETARGARAVRARIADELAAALAAGELRATTDVAGLAKLVETTYHGAMIGWAIHREGTLADWMREQVEGVLAPYRVTPPRQQSDQGALHDPRSEQDHGVASGSARGAAP
jgi:hypothetical protein